MNNKLGLFDVLLALLSVVPILGLIFFFIWRKSNHNRAMLCIIVSIISFIVGFVYGLNSNFNWM